MEERINEWAKVFGHEVIEIKKAEKFTAIAIKSNIIMMPELKILGYMTNKKVGFIEMTKEYNKMEIYLINNK